LLAAFIYGTFGHLFGGYADWGSYLNGHFYLGTKLNKSTEVLAYQYWLSVAAMWLMKATGIWCIACTIAYFYSKKRR